MSLVIDDSEEIRIVRQALQRYRREQMAKRAKFDNGEWVPKGDDTVERTIDMIAIIDRLIETVSPLDDFAEATVTRRSRFS
jgi:hypothetical protein